MINDGPWLIKYRITSVYYFLSFIGRNQRSNVLQIHGASGTSYQPTESLQPWGHHKAPWLSSLAMVETQAASHGSAGKGQIARWCRSLSPLEPWWRSGLMKNPSTREKTLDNNCGEIMVKGIRVIQDINRLILGRVHSAIPGPSRRGVQWFLANLSRIDLGWGSDLHHSWWQQWRREQSSPSTCIDLNLIAGGFDISLQYHRCYLSLCGVPSNIISHHTISYHVTSYQIISSYHTTSYHITGNSFTTGGFSSQLSYQTALTIITHHREPLLSMTTAIM